MKNNFIYALILILFTFSCSTDDATFNNQNANDIQNLNQEIQNNSQQLEINGNNNTLPSNPLNSNTTTIEIPEEENPDLGGGSGNGDSGNGDSGNGDSGNGGSGTGNNCPDFVAPTEPPNQSNSTITIIYNQSYFDKDTFQFINITPQEINCIRQEFFGRFPSLRMEVLQPSDPYKDIWVILGGNDDDPDDTGNPAPNNGGSTRQTPEDAAKDDARTTPFK